MDQNLQNNNPNQNSENKNDNENNHSSIDYAHNLKPIISPISAAFIGLFGGFFLYQIVGGVLTLLVFGLDISKAPVNGLRLMTMAGQILFILLPALLFSKWFYEDVTSVIRFKPSRWMEIGLFVIGLIILIPLLENFSVIQNYFIDKLAASSATVNSVKNIFDSLNDRLEGTYSNLITAHSISEKLLVILVVAAVPAVCEEVMFRGFIQKSFELKLRPFWAILITSIFFGLYHFSPYGLLPLIILGFYFGFAAYKSESIFTSMSLHFLNNFFAIILFFIAGNGQLLDSSPSDRVVDLKSAITIFVSLLILFGGMLYVIIKFYMEKDKNR
jgi:membrane protease YdiL (CAAX protease family)